MNIRADNSTGILLHITGTLGHTTGEYGISSPATAVLADISLLCFGVKFNAMPIPP